MARDPEWYRKLKGPQHLEEVKEFARQPGRRGPEIHKWLANQSVDVPPSTIFRWFQDFKIEDQAYRAAESREKYLEITDKLDPGAQAKATHRLLAQRIYELAIDADDPDTVLKLTRSFQQMYDVLEQLEERDRQIAAGAKELEKAEKSGDVKADVALEIKKALGIIQ